MFAWLDCPELQIAVPFVTNNHFDEDGLFSVFALTEPQQALAMRELLIAASFAGDFGVVLQRDAARLCFIIEALSDPDSGALAGRGLCRTRPGGGAVPGQCCRCCRRSCATCRNGSPRFGALWAAAGCASGSQ